MTDPIADMLTRIRNAKAVNKASVAIPYSKIKMSIAKTFLKAGFIESCDKKNKKVRKIIEIKLRYDLDGNSSINSLKRISKPGQRIYKSFSEIYPVRSGLGDVVVSTSKGIMLGAEARKKRLGGEILCEIW